MSNVFNFIHFDIINLSFSWLFHSRRVTRAFSSECSLMIYESSLNRRYLWQIRLYISFDAAMQVSWFKVVIQSYLFMKLTAKVGHLFAFLLWFISQSIDWAVLNQWSIHLINWLINLPVVNQLIILCSMGACLVFKQWIVEGKIFLSTKDITA